MKIIGIDPGVSPSVAVLEFVGEPPNTKHDVRFWEEETLVGRHPYEKLGGTRGPEKWPAIGVIREQLLYENPDMVVIERVGTNPKWGKGGLMRLVGAYQMLVGIVGGAGFNCVVVTANRWQAHYGLFRTSKTISQAMKKEMHRNMALELYPEYWHLMNRKKDHNRADALLIARWYYDKLVRGKDDD